MQQNYENHRSIDRIFIATALVISIALILVIIEVIRYPSLGSFAMLFMGLGLVGTFARVRSYALTLQDRIIRMEMEVRLERILPDELAARFHELSLAQLIGLRFASDAELTSLTRRALDEKIQKADEVKKLVKEWRADTYRV